MQKIDIKKSERYKTYQWFKSFSNSTYGMNVKIDVTNLVKYVKEKKESFFINFLYLILKGLNSVPEMRMRLENDEIILYDEINPAFTVMTDLGHFENVRFENIDDYHKFYKKASELIEETKHEKHIKKEDYNPGNNYNEYYITCVPWIDFSALTHPIPDDKSSQCVPRICWGKYHEENGKIVMMLNITVSHILVDGYPLSNTFNKIQEVIDNYQEYLK